MGTWEEDGPKSCDLRAIHMGLSIVDGVLIALQGLVKGGLGHSHTIPLVS
jgi:hypothetical protein